MSLIGSKVQFALNDRTIKTGIIIDKYMGTLSTLQHDYYIIKCDKELIHVLCSRITDVVFFDETQFGYDLRRDLYSGV